MSLRGQRVLVTGGTGFVGGRLVEKLILEHGAQVRVLVRDFTNAARIARLDVELVHGEVTDPAAVGRAIEGCAVVFHCAYGNRGDAEQQRAVNVDGTLTVADQALRVGVMRLVHVSTIAVYGRTPDGDVDEDSPFIGDGDHYAQTKREAEHRVLELQRERGLPVTVIRPTCVYGPYGLAFTIDPLRELRTRKVALVNGGTGLCNAVYIDDLVDGMVLAAEVPAAVGEVFLISGEERVLWKDFYGAYERLLGRCSTIAMSADEIRAYAQSERALPDPFRVHSEHMLNFLGARSRFKINKAKRVLGFAPKFDFERGIELTGRWARWARLVPPVESATA